MRTLRHASVTIEYNDQGYLVHVCSTADTIEGEDERSYGLSRRVLTSHPGDSHTESAWTAIHLAAGALIDQMLDHAPLPARSDERPF